MGVMMGIYLYPPATLVVADSALLTAISMGYAFSLAPSLLLSAKNRRLRFGFFAGKTGGELVIASQSADWCGNPYPAGGAGDAEKVFI